MVHYYRKTVRSDTLVQCDSFEKGCWINLVKPTASEQSKIVEHYNLPLEFFHSALDEDEQPRVDQDNGNTLIVIRVPVKTSADTYEIIPLGIILTSSSIITVSIKPISILDAFAANGYKAFSTTQKIRFLMQIFRNNNKYFQIYVNSIEKYIDSAENRILTTQHNEEIAKLLSLQKSIMYFHTAVATNNKMFNKLISSSHITIYEDDKELLKDIIIDNEQVLESLTIFSNILSNTMDAYASIISNNLNIVMKFLTSFTILLSIPTMIASFYGMNVALPMQHNPYAFLYMIALAIMIVVAFAYYFNKKHYF